jgi:hypothetical protein
MMIQIACKSGVPFAGQNPEYMDAEGLLEQAYYKAQGCIVSEVEVITFANCDCDHCKSLNHDFDKLIEEIKEEVRNE